VSLGALWLPIVLSAVFVFIGSAVIWTAFKWHNGDWKRVGQEDELQEALRKVGVTKGQYMFPHMDPDASDKGASKKTWQERYAKGPVGVILVGTPGTMSQGKMMGQMVVYFLVVSFFIAYIASHALAQGAPYLKVFQVVGATSFLAYGAGQFVDSIWFYRSWRSTWLNVLDALIYCGLTAGTFGWLWPR
jgi:hypothetical protein